MAIGGGSAASFRWRSIFRITSAWVMVARIWSAPRWQKGQVPRSRANIHLRSRAPEDALEGFAGSALIISHDRWFLDRVATHRLAFEGDSAVCWFPGNYNEYEADRRRRLGAAADRSHRITYRKLRRA